MHRPTLPAIPLLNPADNDLSNIDVEPEPDDTTSELDVAQADDDRATMDARSPLCTGEMAAAERRGETDAGDANVALYKPLVSADHNPANDTAVFESKTPADHTELVADLVTQPPVDERPDEPEVDASHTAETPAADRGEPASADVAHQAEPDADTPTVVDAEPPLHTVLHTGEVTVDHRQVEQDTAQSHARGVTADERREPEACEGDAGVARPLEGTLMARILELIEASDRPKRPWQIQKELRLARMPSAELSRLLTMGCLIRPKEGIYAVPGRNYGGSVSTEGNQS